MQPFDSLHALLYYKTSIFHQIAQKHTVYCWDRDGEMDEYSTHVTSVIDGDTFKASNQTIRLANINAPESNTPQGQSANVYLKFLIEERRVRIKTVATDFYGRSVAHVWRYSDGLYINRRMVDSGHAAWV